MWDRWVLRYVDVWITEALAQRRARQFPIIAWPARWISLLEADKIATEAAGILTLQSVTSSLHGRRAELAPFLKFLQANVLRRAASLPSAFGASGRNVGADIQFVVGATAPPNYGTALQRTTVVNHVNIFPLSDWMRWKNLADARRREVVVQAVDDALCTLAVRGHRAGIWSLIRRLHRCLA